MKDVLFNNHPTGSVDAHHCPVCQRQAATNWTPTTTTTTTTTVAFWLPVGATASACTTHGTRVEAAIDGDQNTNWACCFADRGLSSATYTVDLRDEYFVSGAEVIAGLKQYTISLSLDNA